MLLELSFKKSLTFLDGILKISVIKLFYISK
jgi:hypothetical protein